VKSRIAGFAGMTFKKCEGSTFQLLSEVVSKAMEMASISSREIDGLLFTILPGTFDGKANVHFPSFQLSSFLGIKPNILT